MESFSFRTEIHPLKYSININHSHKLLLIGSCFAENISEKLTHYKFTLSSNPFGILFNPASIAQCINDLIYKDNFSEDELMYYNEEWVSFKHHGNFSNPDKHKCLQEINAKLKESKLFIKKTDYFFITLGSSVAYRLLSSGEIVANCHKLPTSRFQKVFLTAQDSTKLLYESISNLKKINPSLKIIFTLSPVRYIKDDFIENSLSKANLRLAIHELSKSCPDIYYFPAYEIMMDDLRDYRFYNPDKIHPSETAINYIWNFFEQTFFNSETKKCNEYIKEIDMALRHKPKNTHSQAYIKFKETQLKKIYDLINTFPYLDLKKEIKFFSTK